MSGKVILVNSDDEFSQHFKPTSSFGVPTAIFVDYFAEWCGPCRAIAPAIDALAAKYPSVLFLKVDVDRCKRAASAAGVSAMPTLQAYFGGTKVAEVVGADAARIQAMAADLASRAAGAAGAGAGHTVGGGGGGAGGSGVKPATTADELRARMAEAAERRARGE